MSGACQRGPATREELAEAAARATPVLAEGIGPLRDAFDARRGSPRLVAILTTACPRCFEGAVAVAGPLLRARPDLQVMLIWTEVLPYDSGARKRVELFYDPERIAHFLDGDRAAARALAGELGWGDEELAYDVFLLFDAEAAWGEAMPEPAAWFHQRRDLGPDRYRTEAALLRALTEAVGAL